MPQHPINKERARRAEKALRAQKYWDCGESYAVSDILCDLRHLCDREGWDFAKLSDNGYEHYCAELHADDIEQDARRMFKAGDYPIVTE